MRNFLIAFFHDLFVNSMSCDLKKQHTYDMLNKRKQFEKTEFNGGRIRMKRISGQGIILFLSVIAPLLYISMYLPIWNGKELELKGVLATVLFVFQCISLVLALLQVLSAKLRNSDSCLLMLVFGLFFIGSLLLTCLVGLLFILELFGIPWFPAQR